MNPVLFVDYDGVLHKLGEQALDDCFKLIANPALFCWVPHLERLLTPYPEIQIIVSSDWRRLFPDETLADLLAALKPRVIGAVEVYCSPRSEEIRREVARRGLTHWLALDDHYSVLDAERAGDEHYVGCAPETGLSDPLVQAKLARRLADLMAAYRTSESRKRGETWLHDR